MNHQINYLFLESSEKSSKPKPLYSKTYTDYFVNKVTKSNKKILTYYSYIHYSQNGDDKDGR